MSAYLRVLAHKSQLHSDFIKITHVGKVVIKDNVVLRGDLASIQINKYSYISSNTVLRPSYGIINDSFRYIPMTIGPYTFIGSGSVIEAASIGQSDDWLYRCI